MGGSACGRQDSPASEGGTFSQFSPASEGIAASDRSTVSDFSAGTDGTVALPTALPVNVRPPETLVPQKMSSSARFGRSAHEGRSARDDHTARNGRPARNGCSAREAAPLATAKVALRLRAVRWEASTTAKGGEMRAATRAVTNTDQARQVAAAIESWMKERLRLRQQGSWQ